MMQTLGLGRTGDRIVYAAAALARSEHRYGVTMNADEQGVMHLKGATDTAGYTACGFPLPGRPPCRKRFPCKEHGHAGGGMKVEGRTIDPTSMVWGLRKADVSALARELHEAAR